MSDTDRNERRWSERAWDISTRVLGVLLIAISTYFFVRLSEVEKKAQSLEIKAAVVDSEKNTIMVTLGEIKADIREIKDKIKP